MKLPPDKEQIQSHLKNSELAQVRGLRFEPDEKMEPKNIYKIVSRIDAYPILCGLILAYYVLRLVFYATSISPDIPPDEVTHFAKSQLFSQVPWLPQDTPSTYSLGLVTHIPFLYFLVMGKLLLLNVFSISDLVFLRLVNGALSLATVLVGYKWLRLATNNKLCLLLYLTAITNTAMFTFIGAFVSYDNLVNLLSITAIYYLHLFLRNEKFADFMFFSIAVMAGTLTKFTYLPMVPPLVFILMVRGHKILVGLWREWRNKKEKPRLSQVLILAVALLLMVLNLNLYAGNMIRYHRIVPGTSQVLGEEQAMEYRIFARGKIFQLYKNDQISFDEAMAMTYRMKHVKDRQDTQHLLIMARDQKENPVPLMSRMQYFREWLKVMQGTIVGIMGHQSLIKYDRWEKIFRMISWACLLAILLRWRPGQARGLFTDAVLLVLFYGIILSQSVNYQNYLGSGVLLLSLQGRYIFPVIIPIVAGASYYLTVHWPRPFQYFVVITVGLIFIISDFPFFLHSATPIWFR